MTNNSIMRISLVFSTLITVLKMKERLMIFTCIPQSPLNVIASVLVFISFYSSILESKTNRVTIKYACIFQYNTRITL